MDKNIQQTDKIFDGNSNVVDSETIFRAVRLWYWKKGGVLSPAAFKDENGLSVDRDGDRDKEKVISDFRSRKFSGNLVSVEAKKCREIEIYLKPAPRSWPYHVIAQDSQSIIQISDAKCDLLRSSVKVECQL